MYKLYVRRTPCEEWSIWTETNDIEALAYNIRMVEGYGWQWQIGGKNDT